MLTLDFFSNLITLRAYLTVLAHRNNRVIVVLICTRSGNRGIGLSMDDAIEDLMIEAMKQQMITY